MRTACVRGLVALGLSVLVCLVASGCSVLGRHGNGGGGGSSVGSTTVPRVGQCYDTPDAVLPDPHDPTSPRTCARPHTLETYAVPHADGPLDRQTLDALNRRCTQEARRFLGGGDFAPTAVSVYYFTPTEAQQADGQHWVRCDAGVVGDTAVNTARHVTGSLENAFAHGVPRAYRRCLGARPDPTADQPLVSCTQPHAAEQMPADVALGGPDKPYPGRQRLAALANARCSAVVSTALPKAGRSVVIVPTPQMWTAGTTSAQCWAMAPPGHRLNESEAQPV